MISTGDFFMKDPLVRSTSARLFVLTSIFIFLVLLFLFLSPSPSIYACAYIMQTKSSSIFRPRRRPCSRPSDDLRELPERADDVDGVAEPLRPRLERELSWLHLPGLG